MNRLLAFSLVLAFAALAPAAHAQDPPPAAGAEKKFHNMDSRLAALYGSAAGDRPAQNAAAREGADGRTVRVALEMAREGAPVPGGLGMAVETQYGELVQAAAPVGSLGAVAADENVRLVALPAKPAPVILPAHAGGPAGQGYGTAAAGASGFDATRASVWLSSGTTVTEGAGVMGSDAANSAGHTGKGVKVAVIDTGFDIHNPEIAGNVAGHASFDSSSGIAGGNSRHGTASAEVIVDVAPDVELYLYNFGTRIEFLNLVDHIISRGDIDIVSMSLAWFNSPGPADGTSVISQKVGEARESGILWVNSAGNSADKHWQGRFSDPDGDGWHNFRGHDESIDIDVGAGETLTVILSWWGSPSQDYDLRLADGDSNLLDLSANAQPGYRPFEKVERAFRSDATVHVSIDGRSAAGDADFQLFTIRHDLSEYAVARSSVVIPADSPGSLSVGAKYWRTDALEPYSSQGPTLDGRAKPDVTAPTCVSTTAYAYDAYCGTSAAAPHAAGAAALAMEKHPGATAGEIQALLESTVESRHAKSDRDGTGRVDVSMLAGSDILALDNADPGCDPCFFPETLEVSPGDTVTWVNAGNSAVSVAGDPSGGKQFASGLLSRGAPYSVTFDGDGTFGYSDALHSWATGRVVAGTGEYAWPAISSAAVTGPNQATVEFSKPVAAALGDFVDITMSGEAAVRKFTGISGSGTDTVTLGFAGPPAPPDAAGAMYVGTGIVDGDGNAVAGPLTVPVGDGQAPSLTAVSVASSGAVPGTARAGDAVTLEFTASEGIAGVSVAINGNHSEPVSAGGGSWSAARAVDGTDPAGPVEFGIDFEDAAGNAGPRATAATDGSSVSVSRADASIRGTVFSDANGNGVRDSGEGAIPGYAMVAVDVSTGEARTAVTGPDGIYAFGAVTPHPHATLVQTHYFPFDHTLTTGSPYAYLGPELGATSAWDVGFRQVPPEEAVTLEVSAYRDDDSDGERDPGEPPFPGVTVHTYTYTTAELEAAVTGPGGTATMAGLVPADWLAQVAVPAGYAATSPPDPATGVRGTFLAIAPEPGSTHPMEIGLGPAP